METSVFAQQFGFQFNRTSNSEADTPGVQRNTKVIETLRKRAVLEAARKEEAFEARSTLAEQKRNKRRKTEIEKSIWRKEWFTTFPWLAISDCGKKAICSVCEEHSERTRKGKFASSGSSEINNSSFRRHERTGVEHMQRIYGKSTRCQHDSTEFRIEGTESRCSGTMFPRDILAGETAHC